MPSFWRNLACELLLLWSNVTTSSDGDDVAAAEEWEATVLRYPNISDADLVGGFINMVYAVWSRGLLRCAHMAAVQLPKWTFFWLGPSLSRRLLSIWIGNKSRIATPRTGLCPAIPQVFDAGPRIHKLGIDSLQLWTWTEVKGYVRVSYYSWFTISLICIDVKRIKIFRDVSLDSIKQWVRCLLAFNSCTWWFTVVGKNFQKFRMLVAAKQNKCLDKVCSKNLRHDTMPNYQGWGQQLGMGSNHPHGHKKSKRISSGNI